MEARPPLEAEKTLDCCIGTAAPWGTIPPTMLLTALNFSEREAILSSTTLRILRARTFVRTVVFMVMVLLGPIVRSGLRLTSDCIKLRVTGTWSLFFISIILLTLPGARPVLESVRPRGVCRWSTSLLYSFLNREWSR